jgi:hypothetical protein
MATRAGCLAVPFASRRVSGPTSSATTHEMHHEPDDHQPQKDAEAAVGEEQVQQVGEGKGMNHMTQDRVRAAPGAQQPAPEAATASPEVKGGWLRSLEARRRSAGACAANRATRREGESQHQGDHDQRETPGAGGPAAAGGLTTTPASGCDGTHEHSYAELSQNDRGTGQGGATRGARRPQPDAAGVRPSCRRHTPDNCYPMRRWPNVTIAGHSSPPSAPAAGQWPLRESSRSSSERSSSVPTSSSGSAGAKAKP